MGLAASCLAGAAKTNRFGFAGPEIFPIDSQISQLHVVDLDGDGLNDILVVNNARSKINLLYNQTGKTNRTPRPRLEGKRELNELPPDARFHIESIASEKRIASLAVADLNGDGRPDLAYYGDPKELIVVCNQGTNGWSAPKRWPIDDGQLTQNALCPGDLNGDGRADLVVSSAGGLRVLLSTGQGSFLPVGRLPAPDLAGPVALWGVRGKSPARAAALTLRGRVLLLELPAPRVRPSGG